MKKVRRTLLSEIPTKQLFLLERRFNFKIDSLKELYDNLDAYNKLVQDITNIGKKII